MVQPGNISRDVVVFLVFVVIGVGSETKLDPMCIIKRNTRACAQPRHARVAFS